MDSERIIRFLEKGINALILAVIFFIPLYFNVFLYSSFQKFFLFRALVEILLFVYLSRIVISGEIKLVRSRFFYGAMFAIFATQVIATVFSGHVYISFWGSFFRQLGLLTWIHVYLFAFIVFNQIASGKIQVRQILFWTSLTGSLVSLYALAQVAGFDPLRWQEIPLGIFERAMSTLGQPNYLGSYLLLVLPATFYFIRTEEKIFNKCIYLILGIVQFLALLFTYSRAAWIGLLIAILAFILFQVSRKNKKLFWASIAGLATIFFLIWRLSSAGALAVHSDDQISLTQRLKSIASVKVGSVISRKYYYQIAVQLIKQSPIIGHGLDSQVYLFYKFYKPDSSIIDYINVSPDRAHNEILDIFITTGIVGFAAWCFLCYVFLKAVLGFWRRPETNERKLMVGLLFLGVFASYISHLLGFFTEAPLIIFWLYLAIIFGMDDQNIESDNFKFEIRGILKTSLIVVLSLSAIYSVWTTDIKPSVASYYYQQAMRSMNKQDVKQAFALFNQAIAYAPRENYYREAFAVRMLPTTLSLKDLTGDIKLLEFYKQTLFEQDQKNMTVTGRAYEAVILSLVGQAKMQSGAKIENIREFTEADTLFMRLTEDVPGMARIYFDWGNLYLYQKKYQQAIDKYDTALSLYPDLNDARLTPDHREKIIQEMTVVYLKILEVYELEGDYKAVIAYGEKALNINPSNADILDKVSRAYYKIGDMQAVISIYEHLAKLYPQNDQVYYYLAKAYKEINKKQASVENIKKAITLNSQNKSYKDFLNELDTRP